jgi:hypothetical protein
MSGWTTETLKEHYDSLQYERELRYQQRFESQERALEEAKRSSEKRLDGMNEFRGALTDAQKTFVTWPMVVALILSGCTITGTAVVVVTFFMRK